MTDQAQDFNIHVRYDGRSYEFAASQIDVGNLSTDQAIKNAVALELNVSREYLNSYEIDRHANGNITLHPQATFGLAGVQVGSTDLRTKKQIQTDLLEAHENGDPAIEVETWMDNPWTAVKITVSPPLIMTTTTAIGFSKLCRYAPHAPNDVWNPEYGKTLAIQKAIAKVAKRFAVRQ